MTKEEACKKLSDNAREIRRLFKESKEISDESKVPFTIYVTSLINNHYIPKGAEKVVDPNYADEQSYRDQFGEEVYSDYGVGWQSSVC